MNDLLKKTYGNIKAGDILTLNISIISEGVHIDAGTEFIVIGFPEKIRKSDTTDKNRNGFIRDYFVYGITNNKIPIRTNLNKVLFKNKFV